MFSKFSESLVGYLPNILYSLLIFAVGYIVIRLTAKIMRTAFSRTKLDKTGWEFLISLTKTTLFVILGVMILAQLKVPMSSIITALGTAGLAIGLALRDSLSNVAGGFILMFSRPFKVGDYIEIGGKEGTVCSIDIMNTKLLTVDNKAVLIPNSIMTSKTITNFTQEELRRLELRFNISYDDDHRLAEQILTQTVVSDPLALTAPEPPYVRMSDHRSNSVELLLRVWVRTEDYWELKFSLLASVKDAFEAAGLTIPFEQLDVHMDRETN